MWQSNVTESIVMFWWFWSVTFYYHNRQRNSHRWLEVYVSLCKLYDVKPRLRAIQPRGYGEHTCVHSGSLLAAGSAPWVRGTRKHNLVTLSRTRFSPVGTGNTFISSAPTVLLPVQPRGYGEHCVYCVAYHPLCGSAPWVRGTQSY